MAKPTKGELARMKHLKTMMSPFDVKVLEFMSDWDAAPVTFKMLIAQFPTYTQGEIEMSLYRLQYFGMINQMPEENNRAIN